MTLKKHSKKLDLISYQKTWNIKYQFCFSKFKQVTQNKAKAAKRKFAQTDAGAKEVPSTLDEEYYSLFYFKILEKRIQMMYQIEMTKKKLKKKKKILKNMKKKLKMKIMRNLKKK